VTTSSSSRPNSKQEVVYKIDIGANRYDLLCLEGIARALLVFQGKLAAPKYSLTSTSTPQQLLLDPSVLEVRPHVIGAVLRGVTFTKARYNSFIDLQDKLHMNLARRRTLASMGTHDLDTIQGPFRYLAKKPQDIKFKALNQSKEHTSAELMELYSHDSHLKAFVPIIKDSLVHPVI
jgi:phenylalanyl-tRNA synthetase beta chain